MSKYVKLEDALKAVRDNTMPLDCGHVDRMRAIRALPAIEVSEADTPTDCKTCRHYKLTCELTLEICKYEPITQTETQNSNENSNVISVSDGVSEMIRCAMCNNPNQSYKGCDGACSYDEKLYKRIMDAINASRVEVSEDCISRSALRKEMEMYGAEITLIDTAPSVVPSRAEGEWIDNHNGTYTCSECGNKHSKSKYCSECGAKMKG